MEKCVGGLFRQVEHAFGIEAEKTVSFSKEGAGGCGGLGQIEVFRDGIMVQLDKLLMRLQWGVIMLSRANDIGNSLVSEMPWNVSLKSRYLKLLSLDIRGI